MINFATLRLALYNWVVSVAPSGMPVIYWQLNSPRPKVPYITLFISQITAVNQDWSSGVTDVNGAIAMKGDRQFTLEIQAYGADPMELMENIRTSLQKQSVLDTLRANGIAFYSSLTINDITELVDSQYERRAHLDVLFGIGQVYADSPGFFDHIELTEEFIDQVATVIYNETFLIPTP